MVMKKDIEKPASKADKNNQVSGEKKSYFDLLETMDRGGKAEPSIIPGGKHTSSNRARMRIDIQEKGRPDPN